MASFLIVTVLLFGIYFLSYKTNQLLLRLFFLTTHNLPLTTAFLSLLLYPGVVIHELSHLLMAVILFVPVKSMTLVPKILEGNKLQAGSVTIEKVDPVRRTLVGIAPLFVGIAVLWLITVYMLPDIPFLCHSRESGNLYYQIDSGSLPHSAGLSGMTSNTILCNNHQLAFFRNTGYQIPYTILSLYLIFSISSTMYSSKKDLNALLITIPLLLLTITIAYILGFLGQRPISLWLKFEWIVEILSRFEGLFQNITAILIIPVTIQIILFILLKTVFSVFSILKRQSS